MVGRPLQAHQAGRVHRALAHPQQAAEPALFQCRLVQDLHVQGLLTPPGRGLVGQAGGGQAVRGLVDQVAHQGDALGQHLGAGPDPVGGVLQVGEHGGPGQRRGRGGDLARPGVGAQQDPLGQGGGAGRGVGRQGQGGRVDASQLPGGPTGQAAQDTGLVPAQGDGVTLGRGVAPGPLQLTAGTDHQQGRGRGPGGHGGGGQAHHGVEVAGEAERGQQGLQGGQVQAVGQGAVGQDVYGAGAGGHGGQDQDLGGRVAGGRGEAESGHGTQW